MTSGGSSVRSETAPGSFDFGSNDVPCSYDDFTLELYPTSNGKQSDPSAAKVIQDNRVRSISDNLYGQPEEYSREDIISAVENCLEKYTDNLMMHLEGISGRLTQLELYCYKLERSVGEFRMDMIRYQSEGDLKLKSLEKHVHEVHRSVQIIMDKQELSETQKELAKLQLSQNSTNLTQSQKNCGGLDATSSENKAFNDTGDMSNKQLALSLPLQVSSSSPSLATAPNQNHLHKELSTQQNAHVSLSVLPQDHYVLNHANTNYYTHRQPVPQEQQSPNLQFELHYAPQRDQMQDLSVHAPSSQLSQQPPIPQYQQLWSQPTQPQQLSLQDQAPRLQIPPGYASYVLIQHADSIPGSYQGSSILPAPNTAMPHNSQCSFAPLPLANSCYVGTSMLGNPVYFIGGSKISHLQSYQQGSYSPNGNVAAPMSSSDRHFGDMIEKAVGMGYPRDQVVSALRRIRIAESGQPLDPNLLIDRVMPLSG